MADFLMSIEPRPLPWPEFRAELEPIFRPPAMAPATWLKYRQVLDILEALGVASSAELTPELVARFATGRPPGQSAHTLKALLSTLRSVCSVAERNRRVTISPFRLVRMKNLVRPPRLGGKRCPTAAEVKALLGSLRAEVLAGRGWQEWRARRLLMLAQLVALAGLRAREAQRLHVADCDPDGGVIHVRPHDARLKTANSEATVAMPRALAGGVREWLPHRLQHPPSMAIPADVPWLVPGVRRIGAWTGGPPGFKPLDAIKAAGERAGIEGLTFQALRRAFVTAAVARGVPLQLVAMQARHSEETARRYYLDRDTGILRDALADFDYP